MIPIVGQNVGGAVLEYKVAEGSAANIWAASHAALQRTVAVKFLSASHTSPEAALRFERAGKVMARIQGPYVPEVFGAGRCPDGTPFIVMELLTGRRLDAWAAEHGRLGVEQVARLLDQVGSALATAHELGIVHRNVTPESIFVSGDPDTLCAKLVDFESAELSLRHLGGSSSGHGTNADTPDERSYAWVVDDRHTDRRSLGIVAYWCLTGRHPFESDAFQACALGEERRFIPMSDVRPDLPLDIDAWFDRALSRDVLGGFSSTLNMSKMFRVFAQGRSAYATGAEAPRPTLGGSAPLAPPPLHPRTRPRNGARLLRYAALALVGAGGIAFAPRHRHATAPPQTVALLAPHDMGPPSAFSRVLERPPLTLPPVSASASVVGTRVRAPALLGSVRTASAALRGHPPSASSPRDGGPKVTAPKSSLPSGPTAWFPTEDLGEPGERPASH